MKNFVKTSLLIIALLLITLFTTLFILKISLSKYQIDENKLVDVKHATIYLDTNDEELFSLNADVKTTKINEISNYLNDALIAIEDKRFYSHNGVDYKALLRASLNNLKTLSFKEGGSTITQQLVKNTHLTQDKNIKRKIIEISLAKKLEKKFSKEEILEKYLNTVYFGDNCYGVTSASQHYFNKKPKELTLSEGAFLAGIIKAPSYYTLEENYNKSIERRNLVLKEMISQNYINSQEYNIAINENLNIKKDENSVFSIEKILSKELENNKNLFPYKNNVVKTTIVKKHQNILENIVQNNLNYDTTAIILDKNSNVLAYASTCIIPKRQVGSTIKPLLIYGPALERNIITPSSLILDEKTDFNGYKPSNYNDKYNGYVSAKECISKSLNIPAIKILNMTGIENSANFLKKMNFNVAKEDLTLPLALGAKNSGETLLTIANAYTTFINDGFYSKYSLIKKSNEISNLKHNYEKIFSLDTNFLINDALNDCVLNGTAKKLANVNKNLCAKTGTVGNDNGNSDAYCISYNKEYCVAVWCGIKNNTKPDNNLTGGGIPTNLSCNIWEYLYKDKEFPNFFDKPNSVKEILLDKESYIDNHTIEIADNIAPLRYTFSSLFRENNIPKNISNRFSKPKIEKPILTVNNNEITIQLCLTQYYNVLIRKYKNNTLIKEYDSKKMPNKNIFKDIIYDNEIYSYHIIPYFLDENKYNYGEEIVLDKIKLPTTSVGNDWWNDDL